MCPLEINQTEVHPEENCVSAIFSNFRTVEVQIARVKLGSSKSMRLV